MATLRMNHNSEKRYRAKKLLDSGQMAQALALLDQIIKDSPADIDAIYMAGVCCARSANHALAEKYFRKAVKLNKELFQAFADLGLSQSSQRKFSEAIRSFKKALAINPAFAPAHSQIALAYLQTHEAKKALRHAKKSVEIDGKNPMYLNIQGQCYRQSGQIEKAIDAFKKINTTHPRFYGAYRNLYEAYRFVDDIANAEKALLSAKEHFGDYANAYLSLGKFYEQSSRAEDARELYVEGMGKCADSMDLLVSLGRVHRILGHFDEGLEQVDKALAINRNYQPALAERCSFHVLKGEYEEAYRLLGDFITSDSKQPLSAGLAMAYAHVCRLTGRYEDSIRTLRKTLETPGISDEMKSAILFSLGESHDKIEKYDAAFGLYRKANTVVQKKSDVRFYLDVLREIRSCISSDAPENVGRSECVTSKPVFIVGMPRSGTSLAEQIIASHPDAYGAGEITELWSIAQHISNSKSFENYTEKLAALGKEGFDQYAQRYLAFIESLEPNALRITDKLPHNFMHIGLIRQLFPNAHIIHCHRHPFDTCLSIYFKKFNDSHIYARNLSEIARFYAAYTELMERWGTTAAEIFSLKYEDLVANQEKVTRDIISHIGLDWDDRCLRYDESKRLIATPSYTQANKPLYTGSINRWKHYERHLQPLIDVLGNPEQYE